MKYEELLKGGRYHYLLSNLFADIFIVTLAPTPNCSIGCMTHVAEKTESTGRTYLEAGVKLRKERNTISGEWAGDPVLS